MIAESGYDCTIFVIFVPVESRRVTVGEHFAGSWRLSEDELELSLNVIRCGLRPLFSLGTLRGFALASSILTIRSAPFSAWRRDQRSFSSCLSGSSFLLQLLG